MYKLFLTGFLLIFVLNINSVFSQTTGGSGQAPSPGDFPPYIITPSEDLNQFENTRITKTKTVYRQGQSTITKPLSSKSNAEVNAEIEKRRVARNQALEEEMAAVQTATEEKPAAKDDANSVNDTTDYSVAGSSTLFSWTDKDGILHVTDDIGSVPPEYRDQAYDSR